MNKLCNLFPLTIIATLILAAGCRVPDSDSSREMERPNILFVIADDQSFPYASAYGARAFKTPSFDRVAKNGVLFSNAFVAAPQCSPSRAAVLTGRNIWQLEEAGTHSSYFPKKFPVFTNVLRDAGYVVGYTGKAWGPGNWKDSGWDHNPVGKAYDQVKFKEVPYQGISKTDYAGNFEVFLKEKPAGSPFFFWFGSFEPHRSYAYGAGRKNGLNESDLELPGFLPENDSIINDMLDYALEVSWFDQQLEKMIALMEESGVLENTIIVVTADNGMAFPHAKANLHEYGIHVPLAISGPGIRANRKVDDLVSLIDLAPTFLEVSGAGSMEGMTGRSLVSLLLNKDGEAIDSPRDYVVAGRERHTHARPDNVGYPARAIRTRQFLYIRNFKPDRWPAGDPPPANQTRNDRDGNAARIIWGFEDIDDSPTKRTMIREQDQWPQLFEAAFQKRPEEQLYDIQADPYCLNDLSADAGHASVLEDLRDRLMTLLVKEGDPRVTREGDLFESYPRFGRMRLFDGFRTQGEYNEAFRSGEGK